MAISRAPLGLAVLVGIMLFASANTASAQNTYHWNTATGAWSASSNWSDNPVSGGTTGTIPTANDFAVFNQASVNGTQTISLNAGTTDIAGITFANTGTTLLQAAAAGTEILNLGSGGILVNTGAGAVTIGNATNAVTITATAAQSWIKRTATFLTVVNQVN
jgi:hypothetical protein